MTEILNQTEAQAFINDHFGDRASEMTRLSGGDWSQAYALTVDGQQVVARFGVHGEDYKKDQIMAKWSSEELPIPRVIELGQTERGFFAVSERIQGDFLDKLDNQRMKTVFPSLFRVMDAIRDIDISNTEGYGNWGPDGRGPQSSWQEALLQKFEGDQPDSRTYGWRAALENSPEGARDFDTGLKVLERLAERMPDERHVIHNDLLYHNVLVEGDNISAVLDWGNSMYGDYLYDAAWLLYCQPRYTAWPDVDLAGELQRHWEAGGSVPDNLEARLLCYQIHVGLGAQSYNAYKEDWDELKLNTDQTMKLVEAAKGIL
jgi:hygromycin-B 4-O-kinase